MKPSRLAIALVVAGLVALGLSFVGRPGAAATAGAPVVAPEALAEQGRALYRAKGCATCHDHQLNGAPNLAVYAIDPDFVRTWLRDPSAVRPDTLMPTLRLSEAEIDALIAFLVDDSQ
jgi:mono/diheme cytochrome c family protein